MFVFGESFSVSRQQCCVLATSSNLQYYHLWQEGGQGAVLLERSHLWEPRYNPSLFTILNIPNQEFSHNENSYNTIQGLWPDTAWTPVISQESRKCGPEGNISNGNPAVKFQFSNLSSILSIEVKFNLAKWMDYVILTSIYQIPDIGQNWTLFLPPPLTSHSAVESW